MTTRDPWVELPGRIVGPSLTAAGLAAWVLSKNHHDQEAAATSGLQDALDAALRSGGVGAVRVPRETVERAASVWVSDKLSRLTEHVRVWSAATHPDTVRGSRGPHLGASRQTKS